MCTFHVYMYVCHLHLRNVLSLSLVISFCETRASYVHIISYRLDVLQCKFVGLQLQWKERLLRIHIQIGAGCVCASECCNPSFINLWMQTSRTISGGADLFWAARILISLRAHEDTAGWSPVLERAHEMYLLQEGGNKLCKINICPANLDVSSQ